MKPKSNKLKKAILRQKEEEKRILDQKNQEYLKSLQRKVYVIPKKVRNIKKEFIDAFNEGKITSDFYINYGHEDYKNWVYNLCLHLIDQKVDITDKKIKNVIQNFAPFYKEALRPIETWKAKSHNTDKQLSSLMRHFFANYEVPAFLDKLWIDNIYSYRYVFIHVGKGFNIRKANLPIELTKREAHFMMQAPQDFTINQAIRYGQLVNLGGNERFVRRIIGTRIGINIQENNEFWLSVCKWFLDNPMLDSNQYGPIIDYIQNQKFNTDVFDGQKWTSIQPNFSMKGRDVNATLKQVEAWHKSLGKQKGGDERWQKTNIKPFHHETYKSGDKYIYEIYELTSKKELVSEGKLMHHCVASYSSSCIQGRTSIWSLEETYFGMAKKLLTLEVNNNTHEIVQARGRFNAKSTAAELYLLKEWCKISNLTISRWI